MGNCCYSCIGKLNGKKYLRTRYNTDRDLSIEFENLMDDETADNHEVTTRPVNERERLLLSDRRYDTIVHEQKQIDAEIEHELNKQEEQIRVEEEAYYEAKREASRIASLRRDAQNKANANTHNNGAQSWLGDDEDEWEVAGGEDDFEMFLESVRARSINTRTHQLQQQDTTSNASSSQTKEASSVELEWEHEHGIDPNAQKAPRSKTEEDLVNLANNKQLQDHHSQESTELEWDNDFIQADTRETTQLLTNKNSTHSDCDNNNALPER